MKELARRKGVTIISHNVIYKLLDLLKVLTVCTSLDFQAYFPHGLESTHVCTHTCTRTHTHVYTHTALLHLTPHLTLAEHIPSQEELQSRLPPILEEEIVGEAVIIKVFRLTGTRRASVGGCRVKQGRLVRNAQYRLVRDGEVRSMEYTHHILYSACICTLACL